MPTHAERIFCLRKPLVFNLRNSSKYRFFSCNMTLNLFMIISTIWCVLAAPQNKVAIEQDNEIVNSQQKSHENEDLKTAASSYSHQYSDWGGSSPGGFGYSVTGFGIIDSKYGNNYDGISRYDNSYQNPRYPSGPGYYGNTGYNSNPGYVGSNFDGKNYGGYNPIAFEGNGGYGGYGGNGGLNSYSSYNNPYYQESNHLGYGYYNKRPGFGSIYNSGITPNSITGYRGYSK